VWPTSDNFALDTLFVGMTEGGYCYESYSFRTNEHGGTHLDAPIHFAEGRMSTEALGLDQITGYAVLVDVSVELDENLKPVSLISDNFSRVILNLCNNAFDALGEKAEKNRDKTDVDKAQLSVKTRQNGEHVIIDIQDNGPGIP